MGLKPVLGRLLDERDDGPSAAGAVVLTYKFWATVLHSDPNVIGKTIRLGSMMETRSATVVGVLEPSVPYPAETELIANIVTSPHHLSATMVQGREHRMTDLFGRLAPGVSLKSARAELRGVYARMTAAHPETYKPQHHFQIDARLLRDQINSQAGAILWLLFGASGLLFVIACSNVANLILARTVRRESELAVRAALGASAAALRRSLLDLMWQRSLGRRAGSHSDGEDTGELRAAILSKGSGSDGRFWLTLDGPGFGAGSGGVSGFRSTPAL